MCKKETVYEDNFPACVQRCTDGDASASQIEDKASKGSIYFVNQENAN